MIVEIIQFDGTRSTHDVKGWEFRRNQTSWWLRLFNKDGTTSLFRDIATFRNVVENEEEE